MDDSKQIIANLQAENARLQARIAELEQENFAEYTEFYEHENIWKLHQCCVLEHIKSLIDTIEHIAPNYMFDNAKLKARITELESELNQANGTPANLKGLEKVNYDKAKAKLFAQIVAKSIWDMDTTEQIKSGDMVQYVKSLLLQFDDDSRPQTDEVISDWLRDIKPNYAKQSGRPSKNTPNEIPLTFKK